MHLEQGLPEAEAYCQSLDEGTCTPVGLLNGCYCWFLTDIEGAADLPQLITTKPSGARAG